MKLMKRRLMIIPVLVAVLAAGFVVPANAHELQYIAINSTLTTSGNEIVMQTQIPFYFDFGGGTKQQDLDFITPIFAENFQIAVDGTPCNVRVTDFVSTEEPKSAQFAAIYTCPAPATAGNMTIVDYLFFDAVSDTYDHYIAFTGSDGASRNIILNQNETAYQAGLVTPSPSPEAVQQPQETTGTQPLGAPQQLGVTPGTQTKDDSFLFVMKRFTGIGIEHILGGFDHILFLLAIIIIIRGVKQMIKLITAFTIAHSITLILAAFEIVVISPRIVEPVIALSIAYMAGRNIWLHRKGEKDVFRERYIGTFAFGLMHGLGFAGALAEIGIPAQFFVPALLTFNLGVEIGQFAIMAAVVPYLVLMRQHRHWWEKRVIYSLSGAIGALAIFWTIERIFFV